MTSRRTVSVEGLERANELVLADVTVAVAVNLAEDLADKLHVHHDSS